LAPEPAVVQPALAQPVQWLLQVLKAGPAAWLVQAGAFPTPGLFAAAVEPAVPWESWAVVSGLDF